MKLTEIKFWAQYSDGLVQLDGKAFEWNGIQFVVHRKRPLYDWPGEPLCVSSVETGFGCGPITARKDFQNAAKQAIAKFDAMGLEKVQQAIDKAKALPNKPSERLAA